MTKNNFIKISIFVIILGFILNFLICIYNFYFINNNQTESEQIRDDGTDRVIPVLLYHDFVSQKNDANPNNLEYTCTKSQFKENMQTLLKNGYTPISFTDLYNKIKNDSPLPEKPVIITFDDGYIGEYEIAYPILKTLNIKATIFVVTDWVGNSTDDGSYFSWDNARKMNQSGLVEIYNHSSRHIFYTEIPTEQFLYDILEANEMIDKELGVNKLKVFAYPYGDYNDDMVNALKENDFDIQVYDLGVDWLSNMDLSFIRRINIPMDMTGSEIIENIQSLSYTE